MSFNEQKGGQCDQNSSSSSPKFDRETTYRNRTATGTVRGNPQPTLRLTKGAETCLNKHHYSRQFRLGDDYALDAGLTAAEWFTMPAPAG